MRSRLGTVLGIKMQDVEEEEQAEEVDVPFWDEVDDSNVIYGEERDGMKTVQAGTLNKLVENLTNEKQHDMTYVKTFLLTYQSFTTPEKLLDKLIQRSRVPKSLDMGEEEYVKLKTVIHLRIGME